MVAFAAAALTLAMVAGSAMASTPGGPLYGARLWAETVTLPASGTPRAQAEAQRLGQRLEEIQRASASGDEGAAEAALSAYASILAEARSGTAGDPAAEATPEDRARTPRRGADRAGRSRPGPGQGRARPGGGLQHGRPRQPDRRRRQRRRRRWQRRGGWLPATARPAVTATARNNGNNGRPRRHAGCRRLGQARPGRRTRRPRRSRPRASRPTSRASRRPRTKPGRTGQPGNGHHGRPTDAPGASGDHGTTP